MNNGLGQGMRFFFLAALIATLAQPVRAQMIGSDPVVQPFCAVYKNPALKAAAELMCDGRLLRTFAGFANEKIAFTKMLPMIAVECGEPSAFFDRTKGTIFVCYELGKEVLERIARDAGSGASAQPQFAAGAFFFLFAHELGHAAINLHRLPVQGREEDAADQIATLLLTDIADKNREAAPSWASGAHWLFSNRRLFYAAGHFPAELPPDPQRQLDLACWIHGSDPARYAALAQDAKLPVARVRGCPGEFQKIANEARQMLSAHLKR